MQVENGDGWRTALSLVRAVLEADGERERETARDAAFRFLSSSGKKHLLSLAHLLRPGTTMKAVQAAVVPLERRDRRARVADDTMGLRTSDFPVSRRRPARFAVVADNIRSAFNAGGLFRTADFFGAEKLVLCGYTPDPSNRQVAKTALGASDTVPWERAADVRDAIETLRSEGRAIYALETADAARSMFEFAPAVPCALVLGNERFGLDRDVLSLCDAVLEIPSFGAKNSLNVVSAFAVAAAFLRSKLPADPAPPPPAAGDMV